MRSNNLLELYNNYIVHDYDISNFRKNILPDYQVPICNLLHEVTSHPTSLLDSFLTNTLKVLTIDWIVEPLTGGIEDCLVVDDIPVPLNLEIETIHCWYGVFPAIVLEAIRNVTGKTLIQILSITDSEDAYNAILMGSTEIVYYICDVLVGNKVFYYTYSTKDWSKKRSTIIIKEGEITSMTPVPSDKTVRISILGPRNRVIEHEVGYNFNTRLYIDVFDFQLKENILKHKDEMSLNVGEQIKHINRMISYEESRLENLKNRLKELKDNESVILDNIENNIWKNY